MNEAAVRQGCWGAGDSHYIEGRKAKKEDKGSITIAFTLPERVKQNAALEELFEQGVEHTNAIRALLAA